jgi:hypothetical protein
LNYGVIVIFGHIPENLNLSEIRKDAVKSWTLIGELWFQAGTLKQGFLETLPSIDSRQLVPLSHAVTLYR